MNQSALKTFAQETRRKLRELIGARLDYVLSADTAELRQQAAQVSELRAALKTEGRDPLIERVAYTWFNRLAALRFMDANGYHPFGARVITPATANETLPELLQQARAGVLNADFKSQIANLKTFDDLLAGRIPVDNVEAQIFKLLLVAACNYYHRLMPFLFEKIGDATELLLPDDLLTEHSIVHAFRENLADKDCKDVEVIGWLYQFYISEKKDAVMARKAAVPREDIPAVTQLFTPHWIVRYLVENSLGRLWLLNRPHSKLREKMLYYIEGAAETDFLKISKPEDIRLLDPAGGSGHMLTYAYDLLYSIYEEEGFDETEIPGLILRHNLYGVEICDRAAALAAFAICMKARGSDNRFFRRIVQPNVISLQDVRFDESELSAYFKAIGVQPSAIHPELTKILFQFDDAKNFGSLIQPHLCESEIVAAREKLTTLNKQIVARDLTVALTHAKVLQVLEQAEYLTQRYQVVVANPPYMNANGFNAALKIFTKSNFEAGNTDLYGCFIERNLGLCVDRGLVAMITIPNWMFLSSFEAIRKKLLTEFSIRSLVHNGRGVWGSDFGSCSFILERRFADAEAGIFKRLFSRQGEVNSNEDLIANFSNVSDYPNFYATTGQFKQVPGSPIAYWVSDNTRRLFHEYPPLAELVYPKFGMSNGDSTFSRMWWEVAHILIAFGQESPEAFNNNGKTWCPYDKGGAFRKWFGNRGEVVFWKNNGEEIKAHPKSAVRNADFFCQRHVSWTLVSSSCFGVRSFEKGFILDTASQAAYPMKATQQLEGVLAFLNTKIAFELLRLLNPSVNFSCGVVGLLPYRDLPGNPSKNIANECVNVARTDWDNFETSWDFRDLPLLRSGLKGAKLEASWQNWKSQCSSAIYRMQELETENNRLFIAAYGLQDELKPEVAEDQITLARADARKDMAAFLSYAVGCIMGRYSLDQPGLILADAGATAQDYLAKIPKPTFAPDADGIIPVLDGEWFQDDIVGRFREFLRVTYGEATLSENLAFIEASLGKELPKYFARDFYKDHLKTYKKRPIYWMFSSPEGSFQAVIYLHRYTRDTVNVLLNDYVREFIGKLEEKHRQQTTVTLNESARPGDRAKAAKELVKIDKMLREIRNWERDVILPLAQHRIELDLDDGVKVNYLKFKGAVVNIPGLDKGEEE